MVVNILKFTVTPRRQSFHCETLGKRDALQKGKIFIQIESMNVNSSIKLVIFENRTARKNSTLVFAQHCFSLKKKLKKFLTDIIFWRNFSFIQHAHNLLHLISCTVLIRFLKNDQNKLPHPHSSGKRWISFRTYAFPVAADEEFPAHFWSRAMHLQYSSRWCCTDRRLSLLQLVLYTGATTSGNLYFQPLN